MLSPFYLSRLPDSPFLSALVKLVSRLVHTAPCPVFFHRLYAAYEDNEPEHQAYTSQKPTHPRLHQQYLSLAWRAS